MAMFLSGSSAYQNPNPNRSDFAVEVKTVVAAGTPINPTTAVVPDGFAVVARAKISNKNKVIYVAQSAADCADATKRAELHAGDVLVLYLTDPALLFIDANANGAQVILTYEL